MAERYRAEREMWSARRIERRLALKGQPDAATLNQCIAAYERILQRYPVNAAASDTASSRSLTRLRASVLLELARLYGQKDSPARAAAVLYERRHDFGADLTSTLGIYQALVQLLAARSNPDSLNDVLQEMATTLPAATPDGQPVGPVLEAPLQRAETLASVGRNQEAGAALQDARAYYEKVAAEHAGSPTEVSALIQKASVQARQNQMGEAETAKRFRV